MLWNAKDFWFAIQNSVFIVSSILVITVVLGLGIAVLVNQVVSGTWNRAGSLISPFFVMPAVNAVLWINMILIRSWAFRGLRSVAQRYDRRSA